MVGLASASCVAQGNYTTPRTVGDDRTQWIAGPEVAFRTISNRPSRCTRADVDCSVSESRWWPMPHFAHRVGLGERLELGIHFPFDLGADLKWHAVHAGPLDFALMPRASFALLTLRYRNLAPDERAFSGVILQLPVLVSATAGPFTFVVSPNPVVVVDGLGNFTHGLRGAIGIEWAPLPSFALHPEFSLMDEYAGPSELNWATAGIGIVWKNVAVPRE